MGQVNPQNVDLSNPDWIWTCTPNPKNPNPIPSDAANQANIVPPKANPIAVNRDPIVPNKGLPVVVTKNSDGSTATAHGTVAGTSITVNLPG